MVKMKSVKERLDIYKEMEVTDGVIHQDIWMQTDMARILDNYSQHNQITLHHLLIEILRERIETHEGNTIIIK